MCSAAGRSPQYALFDPTTQMAYIPLDEEAKVSDWGQILLKAYFVFVVVFRVVLVFVLVVLVLVVLVLVLVLVLALPPK